MKQLIEDIAKALVDLPDEVTIKSVDGEQTTVLELKSRAQRSGQGHRQTGPHRALHPHHTRRRRNETEPAFHPGDS